MSESQFHIAKISISWGQIPVNVSFSYGKVQSFPFIIVAISNGEMEGLGEILVPPNSFFIDFLPSLIGCDIRKLDTLLPQTANDHDRILCEGISMALYDLLAKVCGIPFNVLFGGAQSSEISLMPCILNLNPAEAQTQAAEFIAEGYQYLKAKLTGSLTKDFEIIKSIRAVIPSATILQADANEGYKTLPEAIEACEKLGDVGLNIFEDPLKGNVAEYQKLRIAVNDSPIQIMVDLLARSTHTLVDVLCHNAADVIGIHPDQAGSMSRVVEHARMAQAFDKPVVMGGTGYTGIGTLAYMHLTAVCTPDGPCGELCGAIDHGMPCSFVKQLPPYCDGRVVLPDCPGLGVELDETNLNRFREGQKTWRGKK
jgi:muconate cycloisomerase